jgi:hypothetical protein
MRRILLGLGVLLVVLASLAHPPATARGQWLFPPQAPLDLGYGFFGSEIYAWNDSLICDWRLWRPCYGPSGLNFVGSIGAPACIAGPVIYVSGAGLAGPIRLGIDFPPLEDARRDWSIGAPASMVVNSAAPRDDLAALLPTLSAGEREVLARHLRKTSGKETAEDIEASVAKLRRTSAAAKMRASRILDAGDALFREQKHHEALQRYKSATAAAPDMVDSWLRQGFALAATGRYELATRAFKRAAALDSSFDGGALDGALEATLDLADLYGDALEAKASHYDALARAALDEPERADLLYVMAMMLHFDGQRERAAAFFDAARELEAPAPDAAPAAREGDERAPRTTVGVGT